MEKILAELYTNADESFRVKEVRTDASQKNVKIRLERYVRGEWKEVDTWYEEEDNSLEEADRRESIVVDARRNLVDKPHLDVDEITGYDIRYR